MNCVRGGGSESLMGRARCQRKEMEAVEASRGVCFYHMSKRSCEIL